MPSAEGMPKIEDVQPVEVSVDQVDQAKVDDMMKKFKGKLPDVQQM